MDGAWAVVAGEGFVLPVPYVGADLRLSWQIWGFSPSRGRIRTDFPAERPCEGLGGRNVQRGQTLLHNHSCAAEQPAVWVTWHGRAHGWPFQVAVV